jgi:hypothetical protein
MRWKRAWGKRNEWSLRNGNEYFPKPCGAEVYACNVGEMKCGSVEVRNWPERNGDEMECIYRKHMDNKLDIFIFCTTNGWWGLIVVSYIGGTPLHLPLCLKGA